MRILAIDPGPVRSAYAFMDDFGKPRTGHLLNADLELQLAAYAPNTRHLVIESVAHMGMPVGKDVFDTIWQAGRFSAIWHGPWSAIDRPHVKLAVCGLTSATDANVRQAVIDAYGGELRAIGGRKCPRCHGKAWTGRKHEPCADCAESPGWAAVPGPLHGVSGDVWSALAVGIAYMRNGGTA